MDEKVQEYQKEDRAGNFLAKISAAHIIIFGVLVFIAIAITKSQTDPKYNYVIYGILIAIIAVLYFKPSKQKKVIPEWLAKQMAQSALDSKKLRGEEISFDSNILVMPQCQLIWKDDMISGDSVPVRWDIGFHEFVHGTKYTKEGVIALNPYTGEVTGFCWMPLGYSGKENVTRTKIVPVGVVGSTIQGGINPKDFKQQ